MSETEAIKLMEKAHKKATQTSWFSGNKMDEAAELFVKAGNIFKASKKWKEAGDAFVQSALMLKNIKENDESCQKYITAASCYKKCEPKDAIDCIKKALEILIESGRFHTAAAQEKELAEIYDTEFSDLENAMKHYQKAADWYQGENSNSLANGCLLKAAEFAAQLKNYELAIEHYENVANSSVSNQLTKWSVKDYLLKAGICHLLVDDAVGARKALDRYELLDSTFGSTREFKFLSSLSEAISEGDIQKFTDIVAEFDSMTKLDNWKTTMLLRIKESMDEEPSLT